LLLRRKETPKLLHLVQAVCKENDVDIKRSWDLPLLRAIDLGDDDNEFVLSFDSADYSWFVNSQADRDETVWILAQMCKVICGYDLQLGHHVDMDLIGYAARTTGALARYPLLQELLSNSVQIAGDVFSEEETEAEILLSELKWISEAPTELLHTISKQSDTLNLEIIDFLLQWEDDGGANSQSQAKVSGSSKDTYKVLRALANVDTELASVDKWIDEQISHLEKTQIKLQKIENESSALETGYQNVSSIRQLVETVVTALSLSKEDEDLISNPSRVLISILQKDTLRNISKNLKPLLEALNKLQAGLCQHGKTLGNIAPSVWKQLLTVSAVSTQRNRLSELADTFCRDVSEYFPGFVDGLMSHPNMNDPAKGRVLTVKQLSNLSQMVTAALLPPGTELFPRHVDLEQLGFSRSGGGVSFKVGVADNSDAASHSKVPLELRSLGYVPPKCFFCATGNAVSTLNEGMQAQSLFHTTLVSFRPLFTNIQDLDSSIIHMLCQYYTKGPAQEKLYNPYIKAFFKGIQGLLPSGKAAGNSPSLANIAAYKASKGFDFPLKYLHNSVFYPNSGASRQAATEAGGKKGKDKDKDREDGGSGAQLMPWTALAIFLVTIGPIVRAEESFFTDLFQVSSMGHNNNMVMGFQCMNNALSADAEAEVAFSRIHANSYTIALNTYQRIQAVMTYEKSPAEVGLDTIFGALKPETIVSNMLPHRATSNLPNVTVGVTSVAGVGLSRLAYFFHAKFSIVMTVNVCICLFDLVVGEADIITRWMAWSVLVCSSACRSTWWTTTAFPSMDLCP
jgi:hypothetical protein